MNQIRPTRKGVGIKAKRSRRLLPYEDAPYLSVRYHIQQAFRNGNTIQEVIDSMSQSLCVPRSKAFHQRPDVYIQWHISQMIRLGMLIEVKP